jgi:DNA-binding MarR family transcriptional regulator
MPIDRPQAPGYLANLMARLFHEVSAEGLAPLGIRPEQFPALVPVWFGGEVSRAGLAAALECDQADADHLVHTLVNDGLLASFPFDAEEHLVLTAKAAGARDAAVAAARHANQAALAVLTEEEARQFTVLMNRVIDALQTAKRR